MIKFLSSLYLVAMMLMMLTIMTVKVNSFPLNERGLGDTLRKVAGKFNGKATFFHPKEEGGPTGSCGPHEENGSKIVALNKGQYGDTNAVSDWCFKKVLITYGDKTTEATITDCCPGCDENSLDLTPGVFGELAPFDLGILDVTWCVLGSEGCSGGGKGKATSSGKAKGGKEDSNHKDETT